MAASWIRALFAGGCSEISDGANQQDEQSKCRSFLGLESWALLETRSLEPSFKLQRRQQQQAA
eukprot:7949123-Pyramimonas_sp.AAC.1